jgi:acetylornithine/N-succinyldiaminopimelate aminotransferase
MDRLPTSTPPGWTNMSCPTMAASPSGPSAVRVRTSGIATGKKYLDFAGGVAVCPLGPRPPGGRGGHLPAQARTLIHVSNWYCIRQQAELARMIVEEIVGDTRQVLFLQQRRGGQRGHDQARAQIRRQHPPLPTASTLRDHHLHRQLPRPHLWRHERHRAGKNPRRLRSHRPGFVYAPFNDVAALAPPSPSARSPFCSSPSRGKRRQCRHARVSARRQALCREHDLLLLFDEVQCGFGRTGETCGWRSIVPGDEIQPDAISWAKSIGSGFPLGAFWVRDQEIRDPPAIRNLMHLLGPGTHGTTYGGSPLACTAGLATLGMSSCAMVCPPAPPPGPRASPAKSPPGGTRSSPTSAPSA